jgi:predicted small lipoprotein YifL
VTSRRPRRGRYAVPLALLLLTAVAGCGAEPAAAPPADPVEPPAGFGVKVTQYTHDVPKQEIAVQVSNSSDRNLTVESLEVLAPWFEGPGLVDTGTVVEPGRAYDIRVPYGEPRCGVRPEPAKLRVAFTFAEVEGTATVAPHEGADLLTRIHEESCGAIRAQKVAPMQWVPDWETQGSGDDLVAVGTLRIGPVEEGQEVTILGTVPSVIFQVDPKDVPEVLRGGELVEVPVELTPTRCDPHVMADSGMGWEFLFRVRLLTEDVEALVPMPPSKEGRAQLEEYWLQRCGFAD